MALTENVFENLWLNSGARRLLLSPCSRSSRQEHYGATRALRSSLADHGLVIDGKHPISAPAERLEAQGLRCF